jgi:hypothetical protein
MKDFQDLLMVMSSSNFMLMGWTSSTSLMILSILTLVTGKDFGVLELDVMLPTEAVLFHCQLIWLLKADVLVVFFHSGLNRCISLPNRDLTTLA